MLTGSIPSRAATRHRRLLQVWAERRRQRLTLRELAGTQYRLNDIGITRADALREAAKPF
jgi:uncharacterized protein YjiS (DUF1127 family)